MKKTNQHVVRRGTGWAVKGAGKSRAGSTHRTQKAAITKATKVARRLRSEVVIHGRDGRIREKNSYGNDPHPPKG